MKINLYLKKGNIIRDNVVLSSGGITIHLTEKEAIGLIHSLASQIYKSNCNCDRIEEVSEEGTAFTIVVDL